MIRWFATGDARKSGCQQDRATEAGGGIGQGEETGAIGEGVIAVVVLVRPGGSVGAPRVNPCGRLRHGMSDMLDMDQAGGLEEGVRGTGHPEGDQQERQDEPGASQRACSSREAGHFKTASVLLPLLVGAARVARGLDGTANGARRSVDFARSRRERGEGKREGGGTVPGDFKPRTTRTTRKGRSRSGEGCSPSGWDGDRRSPLRGLAGRRRFRR